VKTRNKTRKYFAVCDGQHVELGNVQFGYVTWDRTLEQEGKRLGVTTPYTEIYKDHNVLFAGSCASCGRMHFATRRIEGSYNVEKKCDARCFNAVGPSCDCSCGGKFHGTN
jgi:hypothetical protein